jgi:predicted RNase H-like HicB family nuclease
MKNIIYIQIYKGENQYVAEGMNLPVVTQGKDLDEVVANIKEAIDLHLENEKASAYDFSEHPQVLVNFELPTPMYA